MAIGVRAKAGGGLVVPVLPGPAWVERGAPPWGHRGGASARAQTASDRRLARAAIARRPAGGRGRAARRLPRTGRGASWMPCRRGRWPTGALRIVVCDAQVTPLPAGFQNSAMASDLRLQAAGWYSLMRPPRTGRGWILPSTRPVGSTRRLGFVTCGDHVIPAAWLIAHVSLRLLCLVFGRLVEGSLRDREQHHLLCARADHLTPCSGRVHPPRTSFGPPMRIRVPPTRLSSSRARCARTYDDGKTTMTGSISPFPLVRSRKFAQRADVAEERLRAARPNGPDRDRAPVPIMLCRWEGRSQLTRSAILKPHRLRRAPRWSSQTGSDQSCRGAYPHHATATTVWEDQ